MAGRLRSAQVSLGSGGEVMVYLSGTVVKFRHPRLGFLMTPDRGDKAPADAMISVDNGCFSNPGGYSDGRYLTYLENRIPRDRTLFATAPDVLGSHTETIARSVPMLRT